LALGVGGSLVVLGLAVAALDSWPLVALLAGYVALSVAYTLGLKRIALVDIVTVATGFVVRAVAGGVAAHVGISKWFLVVATFGSLFVVAGKRYDEQLAIGADVRPALANYPISMLRYLWVLSAGVAMSAYCAWAFQQGSARQGFGLYELSIVPFGAGLLRYARLLESGKGSAPEDVILGDRILLAIGLCWVGIFAAAVYVGR
jgi:decaprenyl-phosphate phosphoribosyltransferase